MRKDEVERAAIALVKEYLAARVAWERDAWEKWRRARRAETLDGIHAAYDARIAPFFAVLGGKHDRSFGNPPGSDPATIEVIGVRSRRGQPVVTTREVALPGTDLWALHEYVLTEVDGILRIADIRAETDPGKWISLCR